MEGLQRKVVFSLDLDLYEKAYLLVNSNSELRRHFILCLGELHIIFAHIRTIGSYVRNSGLDAAWMHANWFDSPCLLRQVLKCLNFKRAVSTIETNVITIEILVLKEVIADYPGVVDNEIVNLLKVARESLDNSPEFTSA